MSDEEVLSLDDEMERLVEEAKKSRPVKPACPVNPAERAGCASCEG